MFVLKSKYNEIKEQFEILRGASTRRVKENLLLKTANQTMQEQLTIEKQRVKDLYIELQLLRNK